MWNKIKKFITELFLEIDDKDNIEYDLINLKQNLNILNKYLKEEKISTYKTYLYNKKNKLLYSKYKNILNKIKNKKYKTYKILTIRIIKRIILLMLIILCVELKTTLAIEFLLILTGLGAIYILNSFYFIKNYINEKKQNNESINNIKELLDENIYMLINNIKKIKQNMSNKEKEYDIDYANEIIVNYIDNQVLPNYIPNKIKELIIKILQIDLKTNNHDLNSLLDEAVKLSKEQEKLLVLKK